MFRIVMTSSNYAKVAAFLALGAGAAAVAPSAALAEPAAGIVMECTSTGPGVIVCTAAGVVLHELVQLGNGKDGFGPNGEIMKVLAVPVKIVDGNIKAASNESGEVAKLLRGTTGISIKDIGRYGIQGGPNSVINKPFGN